jgi:hypothetical protein
MEAMSSYVNAFVLKEANTAVDDLISEHRNFFTKESMEDIENKRFGAEKEYEVLKKVS